MSVELKTPYFLIKENLLLDNIVGFRTALSNIWPNSIIAYSVKTNALPWIIKWMNSHGVYTEVVSDEEFQLARLSGISEDKVVFNGPIKTENALNLAFKNKTIVNIDSTHELDYIVRNRPEINGNLGIRVNVNPSIFSCEDVGYQKDGFRFGFCEENGELKKAISLLHDVYGNIPIGLHMHVNSITRSLAVYKSIAQYGAQLIDKYHLTPSYVDIGGGFFGGVPEKPKPEEYISTIRAELEQVVDPLITKLIIEPGSAAIGSAVELHTSVVDVKDTAYARVVTIDGSRIHIDPLWLKKNYLFSVDSKKEKYPKQIICGYTCMDHDRLMSVENEQELSVGDHIVFHRVGNYTVTFGGPFIRPFPPVYVEDKQGIHMVRRQISMEEYYKMETT